MSENGRFKGIFGVSVIVNCGMTSDNGLSVSLSINISYLHHSLHSLLHSRWRLWLHWFAFPQRKSWKYWSFLISQNANTSKSHYIMVSHNRIYIQSQHIPKNTQTKLFKDSFKKCILLQKFGAKYTNLKRVKWIRSKMLMWWWCWLLMLMVMVVE